MAIFKTNQLTHDQLRDSKQKVSFEYAVGKGSRGEKSIWGDLDLFSREVHWTVFHNGDLILEGASLFQSAMKFNQL